MEGLADRELRRNGFLTFYPFIRVRTTRKVPNRPQRRVVWVERPLFSRYLFVGLKAGQALYDVNEANGVATVIYFAGEPLTIPTRVMDEIMDRADTAGLVATEDKVSRAPKYRKGQRVLIADNNPFSGFVGEIILDAGKEIRLWLEVLGAKRPMTVAPEVVGEILE